MPNVPRLPLLVLPAHQASRWTVGVLHSGYLLDELERWEAFAGEPGQEPRLFPVPPRLDLIPMRPFLLDAAQSFITAPSLEHRLQPQQKAGGIASLFGWRK